VKHNQEQARRRATQTVPDWLNDPVLKYVIEREKNRVK
jgi:hypothetical protein